MGSKFASILLGSILTLSLFVTTSASAQELDSWE